MRKQVVINKDEAPFCVCGCGERVEWNKWVGHWNAYINYHAWRGKKHTEQAIQKISDAKTGILTATAETKEIWREQRLGRNNSNCRYKKIDDNFFKIIDTEEKAYLLGWIASDGSVRKSGFVINIHEKDTLCLERLRDIICSEVPIVKAKLNMVNLTINSQQISQDICKLLKINAGKKSDTVRFPDIKDSLKWAFLRGYFDGDGHVSNPNICVKPYPICTISSNSNAILNDIKEFCQIPCYVGKDRIEWSNNNALDFLGNLYEKASCYLSRKRDLYIDWCNWVPSLTGRGTYGYTDCFKWNKTRKDAVAPFKARVSDSGYDLTIIDVFKKRRDVTLYDTGIKIRPPFGWYFMLVPRSSIYKTGYMLANSVGIIDRTYTGNVLVPLIKVDDDAPELELPCRLVQIIPMPIIHWQPYCVDDLGNSDRQDKGFGSSGV